MIYPWPCSIWTDVSFQKVSRRENNAKLRLKFRFLIFKFSFISLDFIHISHLSSGFTYEIILLMATLIVFQNLPYETSFFKRFYIEISIFFTLDSHHCNCISFILNIFLSLNNISFRIKNSTYIIDCNCNYIWKASVYKSNFINVMLRDENLCFLFYSTTFHLNSTI